MKTAGEILKSERLEKGLSLEDISKKTKQTLIEIDIYTVTPLYNFL